MRPLAIVEPANPESIVNAMTRFMAMFDAVRDGKPAPFPAEIPDDPRALGAHQGRRLLLARKRPFHLHSLSVRLAVA